MPKQKILHNRLDDLFADLEQEATDIPADQDALPGWTWECDSRGYYTACSPEVEHVLGVEAAAFLGQPLVSFRMSRQSASALAAILQAGNFPAEAGLQFQAKDGSRVSVRAHISYFEPNESDADGWRGFNQVVALEQSASAGQPTRQPPGLEPITASTSAPSPPLASTRPHGIAVEENRAAFPVSMPYTSAGQSSIQERQTFAYAASPDAPAALAVPVDLQEQSLGLLEIIDDSPNRSWSQDDQRLVEQVADQLSLALENARLFQETQTAMAALEVRERYQKGIAQTVATLAERGTESLSETMRILGEAAQVSRIYYFETLEDEQGLYWRQVAEWCAPGIKPEIDNEELQHLPVDVLPRWITQFQETGLLHGLVKTFPDDEREILEPQDILSIIVLAVSGEKPIPGFIGFDETTYERIWGTDEISALQTAAASLANTIAREALLEQTRKALARTEALFQVGRSAIAFENITELLQSVADTIAEVLPAERTLVAVINLDKEVLTHLFESNAPPIPIEEDTFKQFMDGLTGWCIREHKPALSLKEGPDPRESEKARKIRAASDAGSLIVVPMLYQDVIYGTLTAINTFSQPDFTQGDVDLLKAMANQVATALANSQLFQQEQHRRRIADTLGKTAHVVSSTLDLKDIGDRLLVQMANVVEFDTASLQLIEGDQSKRISGYSRVEDRKVSAHPKLLRSISQDALISAVIQSRQPLVLTDTHADPRWKNVPEAEYTRSWIAAPLIIRDEVIGMLTLDHSEPGIYDEETADLLSAIAAQVSVAVRNARLFEQAQNRSVQLQTAAEVSRAASSILDPDPLIQQTVNLIRDRFNLYYVGMFLVDEPGEWTKEPGRWAVLRAGTGEAGRIQVERGHKLDIGGSSMISKCITSSEAQTPQRVSDTTQRFVNPLLPETRTEIALPLVSRGQVLGAMSIQSNVEDAFSAEDVAVLQTMADQLANALQNANLFDQTQARA